VAGHKHLATTQRYVHFLKDDLEDAARRLARTSPSGLARERSACRAGCRLSGGLYPSAPIGGPSFHVSRLSRSSEDWRRLLTLCALAEVAVIDEQTIYDRGDKDDKLLLELKGTMSEAELHWLGLRLTGARRNKAHRGALHLRVPTGYTPRTPVYRTDTPPLASNPATAARALLC
jgi:hypothetical protein